VQQHLGVYRNSRIVKSGWYSKYQLIDVFSAPQRIPVPLILSEQIQGEAAYPGEKPAPVPPLELTTLGPRLEPGLRRNIFGQFFRSDLAPDKSADTCRTRFVLRRELPRCHLRRPFPGHVFSLVIH
jgi:hypothetical protein